VLKVVFTLFNSCFVLVICWAAFRYHTVKNISYIKDCKKVSFLFLLSSLLLFFLYFSFLKQFFLKFTVAPFLFLFLFYLLLIGAYRIMQSHLNEKLIKKNEAKRMYWTSMSYRYIVSKSFNILFQQMGVLCVVALLKDLAFSYFSIMLLFAFAFGITHIYLYRKKIISLIAEIFIPASFLGGFIFPLILLNVSYGIVYTYMIHWSFYLFFGVLLNLKKV